MELQKHGHACVVLTDGRPPAGHRPGRLHRPRGPARAPSAVLITHEHSDHFEPERLRAALDADPALEIWTNRAVAGQLEGPAAGCTSSAHGDTFTAAGFDVHVHGEMHAVIHPDIPRIANVGFLVDGQVFHPGDALTVPDEPVADAAAARARARGRRSPR